MNTQAHVRLLTLLALTLAFILHPSSLLRAAPLGTAFTYQGRLDDGGSPASGVYDLRFRVWDSELNGTPASTTLTYTVSITNGLFTVLLDFGSEVFTGQSRWLEMSVSTNGAGVFTTLLPRQPITATPYAITAASVSGSVAAGQISGTLAPAQLPASVVTNNSSNLTLSGVFTGNGASVSNVNAAALGGIGASGFWQLGGNNATAGQFLGTTNGQALELRVNGQRALRLEPNASGAPNVIGGSAGNSIGAAVEGATVAGGSFNDIGTNASYSAIGGGLNNNILADSLYATIAGGRNNELFNNAGASAIGGGYANQVEYNSFAATIAGGYFNVIGTNAYYSSIGGGMYNIVSDSAAYATIPGGVANVAGQNYAFAAGRRAKANHQGDFVWADSTDADFASTGTNQFLIRASGGVGINTNNPNGAALNVNGIISATGFSGSGAGLSGVSAVSADLLDGQHGAYYQNAGNLNAGSLSDARLSANVALLNSSQTFSAAKNFNAGLRMNYTDLYFVSGSDLFHGLGWYGAGKLFAGNNVNGPVLYGNGGGALGAIGATTNLALQWTSTGAVALDPHAANTGSLLPGLTFGGSSGEGISSKRTAGTGQFGLDFYANYNLRMRIGNNGNVGIGTGDPQSALHVNGTATVDANLRLPVTTADAGIIYSGGDRLIHTYGDENFFAGSAAGNVSMTGFNNVGVGFRALSSSTSGYGNTACGHRALLSNTEGDANTAIGDGALSSNASGSYNIAVGSAALYDNTTGGNNTAVGYGALSLNTVGGYNTAIGVRSLYWNTNGWFNTANGEGALYRNRDGDRNTAAGRNALYYNTTGSDNIALGYAAGYNLTTGGSNIVIGSEGLAADANTIRIGTQGEQTKTFVAGIYGVTASGGSAVYVNSSGQLGTSTSSRRFKTDIQDMGEASDDLLALRPVTFRYLPEIDPQGLPQFGLIAEEVEQVNPDLVVHDEQGRPYTVRYEAVNAMLLQEFLKNHRQVEAQEIALQGLNRKLEAQRAESADLKQELAELRRLVNQLSTKLTGGAK